ncbi:hypothetical protein PVAND_004728 [Polypedilum vanderplanki]|uniref:Steroid dehydrogenase n=1 Tax=Polypedilum vanderplanki TaxID=319348 RepID=A0A9J6BZ00_POLVA|nr:hypothetical protein PVAND_004728 [Polypedilum vanderplanki]
MLSTFLQFIGAYALILYLIDNFKSPFKIFLCNLCEFLKITKKKSLSENFGEWAVVTGSTDGIGRQYAKELAKNGMNIILISRSESKLIEVAKEIESTYSVKTKYIVADFGIGREIYGKIKQELSSFDIGILVNNVGTFHDYPEYFDKVSDDVLWKIINVNVAAMTILTRFIVPQMKKNKRGIIVNVSSGAEHQPTPLGSIYCASKVYVKFFTLAMQHELKEFNVHCQLLAPMFVKTQLNKYSDYLSKEENLFVIGVESYAQQSVATLGKSLRTTGCWKHGIQVAIGNIMPQFIRTFFVFKLAKKFRNDYIQKHKLE